MDKIEEEKWPKRKKIWFLAEPFKLNKFKNVESKLTKTGLKFESHNNQGDDN